MHNRSVNVELPDEVWDIIDTQFKPLIEETDSEILGNIIETRCRTCLLSEYRYLRTWTQSQRFFCYSGRYDNVYSRTIREKMVRYLSRVGTNNARKNNEIITNL